MRFKRAMLQSLFVFALAGISTEAAAQEVSAEVGFFNKYLDEDLYPLTDEPVVQAGLYMEISQNCTLESWVSHGINTNEGAELDLGGSCHLAVSDDIEVTASIYYDILKGPDIVEMSAGITYNNFEVTSTYYSWSYEDAFRTVASYNLEATERLSIHPLLAFETGFDSPDILGVGIGAEFELRDDVYLITRVMTPLFGGSDRTTQGLVGLNYTF